MRQVVVFLCLLFLGAAFAGCLQAPDGSIPAPGSVPESRDPSYLAIPGLLSMDDPSVSSGHTYQLSNFLRWSQTHVDILIIPPAHGPLVSSHQGVLPEGPGGALPMGAYLDATLHVMEDWRWALDRFAENETQHAWIADITWDIRIVAEDLVTHQDILSADIVKVYTETTYPILGAAINSGLIVPGNNGPGCVAYSTMWMTYGSLTYTDMYALAGHELLHCFGMSHPDRMQPVEDIMSYESWPIQALRCPSNLNVLAAGAAFSAAFPGSGPPYAGNTVAVQRDAYEQYCSPHSDPRV